MQIAFLQARPKALLLRNAVGELRGWNSVCVSIVPGGLSALQISAGCSSRQQLPVSLCFVYVPLVFIVFALSLFALCVPQFFLSCSPLTSPIDFRYLSLFVLCMFQLFLSSSPCLSLPCACPSSFYHVRPRRHLHIFVTCLSLFCPCLSSSNEYDDHNYQQCCVRNRNSNN